MRLALIAFATAATLAAPTLAQNGGGPGGAIRESAMALRTCITAGATAAPLSQTPEAAAAAAIAGCKAQQDALNAQVAAMTATMPPEQQTMIRDRMAERAAGLQADVADKIRAARAASSGTAPAAPAAPGK